MLYKLFEVAWTAIIVLVIIRFGGHILNHVWATSGGIPMWERWSAALARTIMAIAVISIVGFLVVLLWP